MIINLEKNYDYALQYLKKVKGKIIEIKVVSQKRTLRQNNAMHLYFDMFANDMNEAGFDMRDVIKDDITVPFTAESVKEYIWKPVMFKLFGKTSTMQLNRKQVTLIYEAINLVVAERTGISTEFPSWENLEFYNQE